VTLPIVSRCRAALVICVALGSLLPSATLAGPAAPRAAAVVHLSNGTTFNWLVKKKPALNQITNGELLSSSDAIPQTGNRYFGHGSYIFSPAGFGNKSRCFSR